MQPVPDRFGSADRSNERLQDFPPLIAAVIFETKVHEIPCAIGHEQPVDKIRRARGLVKLIHPSFVVFELRMAQDDPSDEIRIRDKRTQTFEVAKL